MENSIKGTFRQTIFKTDRGFIVGLFKVRGTEDDKLIHLINKSITFTGEFYELKEENDYIFYGELMDHPKYGEQFKVSHYEQLMPENKNSVISFLSSKLFPGVGVKLATSIVNTLGDNAIDLILNDYKTLLDVPSMTRKKAEKIGEILSREAQSYRMILELQRLGFTTLQASLIYKEYKDKSIDLINFNIYDVVLDIDGIGFPTVDKIRSQVNVDDRDERRLKACILYIMRELSIETGSTYHSIDHIYQGISNYLEFNIELDEIINYTLFLNKENKIIIEDDKYYLKEYYEIEKRIASTIYHLSKDLSDKDLDADIENLENVYNIKYNREQKEAIKLSYNNNFLVLTGGPGTGKTTIIKAIVELFISTHSSGSAQALKDIALLAPTGRAAKRMMESTGLPAQTIHRFLKWNKESNEFGINMYNKADARFVIVDEASMIDIFLMNSLIEGLHKDIKLILVGDYNQLPSVGPGQVLKDIIDSNKTNVIKLADIYRQKDTSYIINLAYEINNGQLSENYLKKQVDYNFIECSKFEIRKIISDLCLKALEKNYSYKEIQVLIPMYKGINGIDNINVMLQNIFNPKDPKKNEVLLEHVIYREGDKVLQIKNNLDTNISNGDIGIIDSITKIDGKDTLFIDFDGEIVEYKINDLENIRLGYAISIHKAQGSEFDIVIIPFDSAYSRMLYRKLVYTGVTRAKKTLMLVGERESFISGVSNVREASRNTSLKDFIIGLY